MISKEHRFIGLNSIRYVLKKGKIFRGAYFNVRYIKNSRITHYRAAVVVSKKITKSAPKRNRIRRRIYEIIRIHGPEYLENHDFVIIVVNETVATMPQTELENTIISYLKQIQ